MKKEDLKSLFVGGDLSGIQSFLYNISSKRAAVSLRGRSQYLSNYMADTCRALIDAMTAAGARRADTIYCSGGKFYVITDNMPDVVRAIDDCAAAIKRKLWEKHLGLLGINIAYTAFTENDADHTVNTTAGDNLKPGELWRTVNAEFARQKNQKFRDIFTADFDSYFKPIAIGDKPKVCAITGIESDKCVDYKAPDGETMLVLPSVKEQIQLGEKLNHAEDVRSFEDYAGDTYLGVLRMDVDGLGKRFITGFDSINDYEKFSSRLVEFFEKEVRKIGKEGYFHDFINIIYAGGDDLFVVGRWDKTIDFAKRIHDEVETRFKDDGIHISGGLAIVKQKFPIAKAAELAGEAEDAAKHFNKTEKNAFHFLGETVSWNGDFGKVEEQKVEFVNLIKNNGLSKSILHKLMLYNFMAWRNEVRLAEGKTPDFSYVWHASYYLTRYAKRYENVTNIYDFVKDLRDNKLTKKENLSLIALAARWAELELREIEKEKENNNN